MANATTIECDDVGNSLPVFGARLEATPADKRHIFKINADEVFADSKDMKKEEKKEKEEKKRNEYYVQMIDKLNNIESRFEFNLGNKIECEAKRELKASGLLLREAWKKYEKNMRVHRYDEPEADGASCGWKDGEYGVYMNLERAMRGTNWVWGYHSIFHELFHVIFEVARIRDKDIVKNFGEALVKDVNELLEEEKNAPGSKETKLRTVTYDEKTPKKDKAALYDIIGAVLYRGKYGCVPSNPKPYIGRECEKRHGCKLETNDLCNEIFGHGESYWGKKTSPPTLKFYRLLAEEAFVHMAAEAIVNQKAYKSIVECLPKSYKMFKEILMEMLPEELSD